MTWMGRLLGRRTEERSYTEAWLTSAMARAEGTQPTDYRELAATQLVAGLVGRALSTSSVEADAPIAAALSPSVLYDIGAGLGVEGEAVHLIDVDESGVRLIPAAHWEIHGSGTDPDSWMYRLEVAVPDGSMARTLPGASVLHARWHCDPMRPWQGRSPIAVAAETTRLAGGLERALADEAGAPVGRVLPAPLDSLADEDLADLRSDLGKLHGKTALVPSMQGSWGDGQAGAPADWKPQRIGGEPPDGLARLRTDARTDVLAAVGIPAALFAADTTATGRRESFRQVLHTVVQPIGELVSQEATRAMSARVKLTHARLEAGDLQGRARSFAALAQGGMSLQDAAAASGVLVSDE